MTISERIFELLEQRGMSQKEFSEKTGIAQSSISDWKRKKANHVSEKILIICNVLDVMPYELLGGTDGVGSQSNPSDNDTNRQEFGIWQHHNGFSCLV